MTLITFFAFPIVKYGLLKRFSKKEGQPQLWYLPQYGFRLVIRNLPRKIILKDIKYRVTIRKIIPSSKGSSVKTFDDKTLFTHDDFFLFPGTDQILLNFQLQGKNKREVVLIQTDKLGNKEKTIPLEEFDRLIVDYSATIQNLFNFNVQIAKRVEIETSSIRSMWETIQEKNIERIFKIDRIRDIG